MTIRHQDPDLRDASGNRIIPRTLLETVTVAAPVTDVTLTLPTTPYKRFQIEIDNWGSTANAVYGRIRAEMNGEVRFQANDYSYHAQGQPGNNAAASDNDDTQTSIWVTRDNAGWKFGSGPDEAYSFNFDVDPGVDSTNLPKFWWRGSGVSDTNIMVGYSGAGMYRGKSSLEFGRITAVQFTMSTDSIREGEFRLYGTE